MWFEKLTRGLLVMVSEMPRVETKVVKDEAEVERRLRQLGLDYEGLLQCRDASYAAGRDAGAMMPITAPGTMSYHYGTEALRKRFVPEGWELDRTDGIESIRSEELRLKVVFQNVDLAANHFRLPKPRNSKGAGSERECAHNLFEVFGLELPHISHMPRDRYATYYLMVDDQGAAELSRPLIIDGQFKSFVERILLSDAIVEDDVSLGDNLSDVTEDFDVPIRRR